MKFLYSDTHDYVDPEYDFINDRNAPGRQRYWDDRYAHELLCSAPYDGLLVALSAVKKKPGVSNSKTRYSLAEEQRFLRDGARAFLRFEGRKFRDLMLMGDCGAFAYADQDKPAYSPEEVLEFYADSGFTHGCSPDHIIFGFDPSDPPESTLDDGVRARYHITLEGASDFLRLSKQEGVAYEPLGAVQGWSPESMASAAVALVKMGYTYLAIGGLVPLRTESIHLCLRAIRSRVKRETRIHLLGFAKAEQIGEFVQYEVASFDSTSPLIRAFKDKKANYYMPARDGGLDYYAAIRVPQALENPRLMNAIKSGVSSAEELVRLEARTLKAVRDFDVGIGGVDSVSQQVVEYQRHLLSAGKNTSVELADLEVEKSLEQTRRTLSDRPWKLCSCTICSQIGIEVMIFRASNRNKRRGFHNLYVYHRHLQQTLENA